MDNTKHIKQLHFGVSFNTMFKILDIWGEIADDILYKNKYFSPEFFTNISTQYTTERVLFNPEMGHRLLLTSNNLVFTQTILDNYDSEYAIFKKRIVNYLVPNILSSHGLVVRRLGMVFITELDERTIERFGAKYFNPAIHGIHDFRFSRKEVSKSGLILAGNSDFVNKIFSVGNLGVGLDGISYDFQLHFSPLREDVRDSIEKFLNVANQDFSADVLEGLGKKK